jgi:hypothetical protein
MKDKGLKAFVLFVFVACHGEPVEPLAKRLSLRQAQTDICIFPSFHFYVCLSAKEYFNNIYPFKYGGGTLSVR